MCGIIAVFGRKNAPDVVIRGLKTLEYRGYDSWGVGAPGETFIAIEKQVGKISEAILPASFPQTDIAFGQTRWATHGGVTQENAHPHFDESKKIAVVMNGIIENFVELRSELRARGHLFSSDTDTEVLVHLVEEFLKRGDDFRTAVINTIKRCEGRIAFVMCHFGERKLIGLRKGSPLILGLGKGEYFLASDTPAFLEYTKDIYYIDDGELVEITDSGVAVLDYLIEKSVQKRKVTLDISREDTEKGDHEHFMMKEIYEQKQSIMKAIDQNIEEIKTIANYINHAQGTFIVGCGTAHKMAKAGEYFFSAIAKKHINTAVASEFPLFHDFLQRESLIIAISQSGETADVIEAIEAAKSAGSKVLSVVNVEGSTIARMSDFSLFINAGTEKAVASTKASMNQLAVLLLLAFASAGRLNEGRKLLVEVASAVNDLLNPRFVEFVAKISKKIAHHRDMFIIGKSANYPLAKEAAIKIQEVSYIHAEGFAGGELKHGPIALIEKGTPALVLVSDDEYLRKEILSNAMEIKARGGHIIGIAPEKSEVFDDWIRVPHAGVASPMMNLIPVQVLAYFLALERGHDPDKPRNLAKSVTVK